jgi:integrase
MEIVETVCEINGRLLADSPKNHARRSIAMPPSLRDALAAHVVGKRPDDYIFSSSNGSPLRSRNWRRDVFEPAVASVGLDGLTSHQLRHTAASLMVDGGANVLAVARQLGHEDPSVTLRVYADLFDDQLDALGARMNRAIVDARADFLRTGRGLKSVKKLSDLA